MKGLFLTILCALASAVQAKDNSIFFIENVGQVTDQYHQPRKDIDFTLQASGMSIFICAGTIHFQFSEATPIKTEAEDEDNLFPLRARPTISIVNTHRIDLELSGANRNMLPEKQGQLSYYERYYIPQFGQQGGMAHAYSRIIYKDIYPKIDWVIYINDDKLEYDFIVHEGADASDIQLHYSGATVNLDAGGNLIANCAKGSITEHAPVVYQSSGEKVAASFNLQNDIVSFNIAAYKGSALIDPYIEWATYYGGGVADDAQSVVLDASGNVYIGGRAHSIGNIATSGAFDVNYADSGDAYVAKFDSNGVRLWATYYGGISPDWLFSLAYDNQGHIFADGLTYNISDISTSGSDQPVYSGGGDAYLVKFDSAGTRLWATYFGGNSYDTPGSMACDETGNIYMGGMTASLNISTISAHQASFGGNVDGFIVKYNSSGTKLWCTYYGGVAYDQAWGLTLLNDNTALYIGGSTLSNNNIATSGTYQPTKPNNGQHSAYIARFDTAGNRQWGTFFGGTSNIGGTRIDRLCCDNSGNIIVSGYTDDTSGMVTTGCHQSSYGGAGGQYTGDGIIAKFSPTGSRIWSTYFGGSADDILWAPVCNSSDEIYVVGRTQSTNNIAINAFQANFGGGGQSDFDGWVAKLSSGGACIWSTYLGGNKDDGFQNVTTTENNSVYIAGYAASAPTTVGSHQPNYGGQSDGYLIKFKDFPTGIEAIKKEKITFNIYPNPNSGAFSIECNNTSANEHLSISIHNITGQLVHAEKIRCVQKRFLAKIEMNRNLSPGVYMLTVTCENFAINKHFVKSE